MNGIVAWAHRQQASLVRGIVEGASTTLEAVAAPTPSESADLAKACATAATSDLRRLLQTTTPSVLLLLSATPPEPGVEEAAVESGVRVVRLEPRLDDEAATNGPAVRVLPRLRCGPGFLAARDVLPEFGPPACLSVECLGAPGEGTLAARLFDAMDALDALASDIETIDASLWRPGPSVPERIADLGGHLTANLRLAERRGAVVVASDCAGRWGRRVVLVNERGTLEIGDGGFTWHAEGRVVDEHVADGPWDAARLLAWHVVRMLDHEDTADPPADRRRLQVLCETARLSCRTGQGESPRRMLELLGKT